jgi:Secretion system C-terminal sorting domain
MSAFPPVLLLAVSLFLNVFHSQSQIPGFINRPATSAAGRTVLDPVNDGYTSLTTAGFGNNDVNNSEIAYRGIKAYSTEPYSDLRRGPNHSYSDFVPDSSGNGVYHFFSAAQNVQFRMRLGSVMPGSKGYSILMDTDGKFGASGPNADPNYLPATTGTNGNPGFEIEIVLETNFRIAIYNVNGTSSPVLVKQYTNWQEMSQVSIASTNDNGDPDFLIDFYIPFSDLQAAPFNLTTASPIRMCATTVMSPQAAIGGPRSDIYGVSGNNYEDFIDGQPACLIFNNPVTCPTAMCTAAPLVNSPLNVGTINISGTWTKSSLPGAANSASITIYKNGLSVGTLPNIISGATWSLNGITLISGDSITAKAIAVGETMCLTSNLVRASACNSTNIPATPILTCSSGSKGMEGTNLTSGWRVNVENLTRNVLDNSVSNTTGLFGSSTGTSPNITWIFSGGCSTGAPLTSGSYKIYYTNAAGCNSLPAYFCAAGNGGTALAGALTVPVISAPANAIFTTATTSITGTTDANATVTLYVNGTVLQTTIATGGNFTFSNLTLIQGQQLYILTELNTGTVSTSKCAAQTALFTVSCFTQTPLINADNNNQLTAGAPITGTSSNAAGTVIRVYTAANALVATTTVQANGSWSTASAGTTPAVYNALAATSYYANAQTGSCGISNNTTGYAAVAPTAGTRCGTITGPVGASAGSISGALTGSFSTTTVNLYLDDQLIGSAITSGTAWGPITVNTTAANTIYSNGVLKIGVQESGKQEVSCPTSATTITCTPTPVIPVFTPANTTININEAVTYTISNAIAGTFYAIADSASGQSLGIGKWATTNGTLSLTTSKFATAGSYKIVIKSSSLSGVTICSAVSSSGTNTVNDVVLPVTLLQFKGKKQGGIIFLDWITTSEIQVNRFEIERSSNGIFFQITGTVAAIGNSQTNQFYAFADKAPLPALNYYRLKMIDNDGRFTYSSTLVFEGNQPPMVYVKTIKPNPFKDVINIEMQLPQKQSLKINLIDMAGRVVRTKDFIGIAGNNSIYLDGLSNLTEGIYFLKIISADAVLQERVLKIN